ncbi:439_t:CDS:2, partial [Entrophospora sp. SA101]
SNALDLFDNMKYPKGRNQGKIISPHIQKKAIDFLNYGLYKKKSTIKDLEEENKELKSQIKKFGKEKEKLIKKTQSLGASKQHFKTKSEKRVSTIRSLVRKSGNFSENEFKNQVKSLFKINKNEYSPQMVWLATRITQVGQVSMHSTVECLRLVYQFLIGEKPKKWLSRSTLKWLSFLRDLKENFDIVFGQELLEALELLDSDEWGSFKSWVNEPSQIEINYAEQLQNDLENFFTDDFAKIQLTNGPIDKINIENNLNEIRAQQKRQKLNVLQENIQQHYGQNYANSLYSNLFQN